MWQNFNPLTIGLTALISFTTLHLGLGWIENKYKIGTKSFTIWHQNRKIKKLEKSLVECYNIDDSIPIEEKRNKCLLKASKKRILKKWRIKRCKRRYRE